MGRWKAVLVAGAALALAAALPASARDDATKVRCCFLVTVNETFELDNAWHNPPSTFTGPSSHGFLVTWAAHGIYEYAEHNGKPRLEAVGVRPRIAAYLNDHDSGAAVGNCLHILSTSGDIPNWPTHWLAVHGTLLRIAPGKLSISAGPPFQAHLATCGGTFTEDAHSDTSAAKFGMQGPWSYSGHAPKRVQLRSAKGFVTNVYTINHNVPEHGTPPHETDGHSNAIVTFFWFRPALLKNKSAAFNIQYKLNSSGFRPA